MQRNIVSKSDDSDFVISGTRLGCFLLSDAAELDPKAQRGERASVGAGAAINSSSSSVFLPANRFAGQRCCHFRGLQDELILHYLFIFIISAMMQPATDRRAEERTRARTTSSPRWSELQPGGETWSSPVGELTCISSPPPNPPVFIFRTSLTVWTNTLSGGSTSLSAMQSLSRRGWK